MESVDFKYNWGKFYWDAWLNDIGLQSCDLAAQGLWINLIAIMHKSDQIGYLVINGRPMTVFDIAKRVGIRKDRTERLLKKLMDNDVCSVTDDGVVYCRRIIREEMRRYKNIKRGDNQLTRSKPIADYRLKSQGEQDVIKDSSVCKTTQTGIRDLDISLHIESVGESIKGADLKNNNVFASRLPKEWFPNAECRQYAVFLQLCPDKIAEDFCDYWHAKAGKEAVKMDWEAVWRRWCRVASQNKKNINSKIMKKSKF